jgi:hypothetical protein
MVHRAVTEGVTAATMLALPMQARLLPKLQPAVRVTLKEADDVLS